MNKETLKNAWTRFEEEGIIIVAKSRNTKIQPRAKLAAEWQPARDHTNGRIVLEGRLWAFIEKIAQSRREGKNRRDGATVSTRVLRHTETIAETLFREPSEGEGMSEEDRVLLKKQQRRRLALQARAHL